MTVDPIPLVALREAHAVITAAVQATTTPPGPLLHAAVEVADALEAAEDETIESATRALAHLWPPARTRTMLRYAVRVGAVTVVEVAAWAAAGAGGGGLKAEVGLLALLGVIETQEVALAGRGAEQRGGERG